MNSIKKAIAAVGLAFAVSSANAAEQKKCENILPIDGNALAASLTAIPLQDWNTDLLKALDPSVFPVVAKKWTHLVSRMQKM